MGFWDALWRERAKDWLYHRFKPEQVPNGIEFEVVEPNKAYANIWLKAARIVNLRAGLKLFYGAVHSQVSVLPVGQAAKAEVNTVVTPGFLKNVDSRNLDRVVSLNHRLLGPIAHSGNDVEIEVGLFSIAQANLVAPYLGMLEKISNISGVGFLSAAIPFAAPLKDGINAILSGQPDNILEIGLARTFNPLETGFHLVMRVPQDEIDPSTFRLETENWRVLGPDGKLVKDFPYMVFEVSATREKFDWPKIPELKRQYELIQDSLRRGDAKEAAAGGVLFRRIALTSPDLIREDAERLSKLVKEEIDRVLGDPIAQAKFAPGEVKDFDELNLYLQA